MKRSKRQHALTILAMSAAAVAFGASPALAQASAAGGNIGAFIDNIISILNSNVIRGLAVIAVIITGIAWMFGHLDMRRAGTVIVGIIVIFSAAGLVDLIVGGGSGS